MEEKIYEMEYFIDGEKYVITATKVENEKEKVVSTTMDLTDEVAISPDSQMISLKEKPEEISLEDWLNLIVEYGIVITK